MKHVHYFLLAMVMLAGCSDESPQAMFEDYLYRLGNVTGVEPQNGVEALPLVPYPGARNLVLETEDLRIGFADYFNIAECDLMQAVSERNSSLGLFQRPSGRLLYEIDFYHRISHCDDTLGPVAQGGDEDRAAFRALVSRIRESKSVALPVAFWNATFASPEMRILLSTGAKPFDKSEPIDSTAAEAALSYLAWLGKHLYEGRPRITTTEFERHYFNLQAHKTVGRLIRNLRISHLNLVIATDILERAGRANKICPMGKKTRQGGFLHNVFIKYYAGEIQPYLSRVHRPSGQLLGVLGRLFDAQSTAVPEPFLHYFQAMLNKNSPNGLWRKFNDQLKEHTLAWQTVLKQCALMPEGPVGR
ncbi:MAG: DUF3080 family protein [Pseudomonadota bacterium]